MRANTTLFLGLCLSAVTGCGGGEPAESGTDAEAAVADAGASSGAAVVGTIRATLGDEERSWNALFMEQDGDPTASSTYQIRQIGGRTIHMLFLGGNAGTRPRINETLRLTINSLEPLADCPCTFENEVIEYWIDSSNRYEASGAVITVERFEESGEGEYRASGSFMGTLAGLAGAADSPTGETVRVEGTFDIDRILRTEAGR